MTFGQQVDKGHICVAPLIKETCYKDLFKRIGFDVMPIGPKGPKKFLYPSKAPEGQHPTAFLQFGVQIINPAHLVYELGDHARIMRFDFRENWPEGYETREPFYQLDEINIWDGDVRYSIDCEDAFYLTSVQGAMNISKDVILAMWRQDPWDIIKGKFDTLTLVIKELDEISVRLDQQHAEQMAGLRIR